MLGLGTVTLVFLRARLVALLLAIGGAIWLYLFAAGVRVGDDNGRPMVDAEPTLALVAVLLMALGLIGLGLKVRTAGTQLIPARTPSQSK